MSYQKIINIKGDKYLIEPSKKENKKYDVYLIKQNENKYITSFGDKRYEHYKDKFGYYSKLDHNDKKRRDAYRSRHKNDYINDPNYAGFWAYNFLW